MTEYIFWSGQGNYSKERYCKAFLLQLNNKLSTHSINLKTGDKILDLGCGNNNLAEYFSNIGYNVIGIDYRKELLDETNKINSKHFLVADINYLPFKDESFELVTSSWILDYTGPLWNTIFMENLLKEAHRVLKKQGVYFIRDFDDILNLKIAKKTGFKILDKKLLRKP